jgi:pyruvate kinase
MTDAGPDPHATLRALDACRARVTRAGDDIYASWADRVRDPAHESSLRNLAHYLALRRQDLRELQESLSLLGLSSLGRAEARVLANLDAIRASLAAVAGAEDASSRPSVETMRQGRTRVRAILDALAGPPPAGRSARILVTLPLQAAEEPARIGELLDAGADMLRINAAHGDPDTWHAMVDGVRREAQRRGREVRILIDLPGPGVRTRMERKTRKLEGGDRLRVLRRPERRRDVGVSAPEVLDVIPMGALVSFDDGRLEARVIARDASGLTLVVTQAREGGDRIRPDKGVGVPGVPLPLASPSEADLAAIDALADRADLFGLSFVRSADDIARLQDALRARRGELPGIVAKIETARAIRALPEILAQGAGHGPFAVMIARGDLAVEIGFERLAEIQEELLWVCEAAHVPIVWATQVLESLAKSGLPSRAEITDAAMAQRAEIVMLNKGAFVTKAIGVLDDVLRRMEGHAHKKSPSLRALAAWAELVPVAEVPGVPPGGGAEPEPPSP